VVVKEGSDEVRVDSWRTVSDDGVTVMTVTVTEMVIPAGKSSLSVGSGFSTKQTALRR